MSEAAAHRRRIPRRVRLFNPLAQRLLGAGLSMGPDVLLTVRGRKSGLLRTTPVAVVEVDSRRWLIGTFGDVNWTRNLRAAGEGIIETRGHRQPVRAVELTQEEAARFFGEVLVPFVRRHWWAFWVPSAVLGWRHVARELVGDPAGAARRCPVFELHELRG